MDNRSQVIECLVLNNYLEQIKDLLKYRYKVHLKIENSNLKVFGDENSLSLCKKFVDYLKVADSQYLLAINKYTREALKRKDLVLLFESKCKVLLSVEENILYFFGELARVKLLYAYILKYDRLVGIENVQFIFTEDDETRLEVLCSQYDVELVKLDLKTRVFIFNLLLNIDGLLKELGINDLTIELENTFLDEGKKLEKASARGDITFKASSTNSGVEKGAIISKGFAINPISPLHDNISNYRTIIIDGNNLAFGHGGDKFSYMGIKLAIDYFVSRGHTKIYALLPRHRQPLGGTIFEQLEREDRLKYTPSRKLNNVRETPYDDRFILDAALFTEGVVLSNDQYRDLMGVPKYLEIISNRLIPYTFIENHLIIPDDPRGYNGPSLWKILSNPCKVAKISPKKPNKKAKSVLNKTTTNNALKSSQAQPAQQAEQTEMRGHQAELYNRVRDILPAHSGTIRQVILGNPNLRDANTIINYVLMAITKSK